MVEGVRQYVNAIAVYHATNGEYPKPPAGFTDEDRYACMGQGYLGDICLTEDVINPYEVTNKAWFDNDLKQISSSLPSLPRNVQWLSGANNLEAGSFYVYTEGMDPTWNPYFFGDNGVYSATAAIIYYLEGTVPEMCSLPGSLSGVHVDDAGPGKYITICVIPLGDVVME